MIENNRVEDQNMTEKELPQFLEISTNSGKSKRCVDGRPDVNSELGPQMLGGSILPIFIQALYTGQPFNDQYLIEGSKQLTSNGLDLGAHRGAHAHDLSSDCGFADRLKEIFTVAVTRQKDIQEKLSPFYKQFATLLGDPDTLSKSYEKFNQYNEDLIQVFGESLIENIESQGGVIETVQGDHAEQVAFVNVKENITLDTNEVNNQGGQAFNLDLWAVLQETKVLGIEEKFAAAASLILYQATEIVLVENKGKPALQVIVHT